jgi:hypothetical protein
LTAESFPAAVAQNLLESIADHVARRQGLAAAAAIRPAAEEFCRGMSSMSAPDLPFCRANRIGGLPCLPPRGATARMPPVA